MLKTTNSEKLSTINYQLKTINSEKLSTINSKLPTQKNYQLEKKAQAARKGLAQARSRKRSAAAERTASLEGSDGLRSRKAATDVREANEADAPKKEKIITFTAVSYLFKSYYI